LIPQFARMRLYTYPFPSEDPVVLRQDCYWTAMNFFNAVPDDRFINPAYTKQVLMADYYPVQSELTFGDVVFLFDSKGQVLHSAVYLADDVVFTKNGAHYNEPWTLMKLEDMLAYYPSDEPLRINAYRLKKNS